MIKLISICLLVFILIRSPKLSYMDYASTSDIIDFEIWNSCSTMICINRIREIILMIRIRLRVQKPYTQIERYYYELYKGNMTQVQVDEKINAMRKNDYRKRRS